MRRFLTDVGSGKAHIVLRFIVPILVWSIVGCTGSAPDHAETRSGGVPEMPDSYQDPSDLALSKDEVRQIARGAPVSQVDYLSDGVVSRKESSAALSSMVECAQVRGVHVEQYGNSPVDSVSPIYSTRPNKLGSRVEGRVLSVREADEVVSSCEELHLEPTLGVYRVNAVHRMSDRLLSGMKRCFQKNGRKVPAGNRFADFAEAPFQGAWQEASTCLDAQMKREYPKVPFYPEP